PLTRRRSTVRYGRNKLIRRMLLPVVLVACTATVVLGAQNATFVMKNGERISGTLSYKGGNNFDLNVNGQPRSFPQSDIALIAFVPGDPATAELNQLPQSDNPTELQRNLVVKRDGSIVRGKVYKIS